MSMDSLVHFPDDTPRTPSPPSSANNTNTCSSSSSPAYNNKEVLVVDPAIRIFSSSSGSSSDDDNTNNNSNNNHPHWSTRPSLLQELYDPDTTLTGSPEHQHHSPPEVYHDSDWPSPNPSSAGLNGSAGLNDYTMIRRATFPYARQERSDDMMGAGSGYPAPPFLQPHPSHPHPAHPHHHMTMQQPLSADPSHLGHGHGGYSPPRLAYDYHHSAPHHPGEGMYGAPPPPNFYRHPGHGGYQQQQQQPHMAHGYPPMNGMNYGVAPPYGAQGGYPAPHGLPVQHTDDAASKETQYLRRRCFNCHTTEPPSWRRSTLNPGKIVCNKCGLYERTHLRARPLRFDELRAGNKARKGKNGSGGSAYRGAPPPPPPQSAPGPQLLPPLADEMMMGGGGGGDMLGELDYGGGRPGSSGMGGIGGGMGGGRGKLGRRTSVSSTGSGSQSRASGASDWDDSVSVYSNSSSSAAHPPSSSASSQPQYGAECGAATVPSTSAAVTSNSAPSGTAFYANMPRSEASTPNMAPISQPEFAQVHEQLNFIEEHDEFADIARMSTKNIDWENKLTPWWNAEVNFQPHTVTDSNMRLYYKIPQELEALHKKLILWSSEKSTLAAGANFTARQAFADILNAEDNLTDALPAIQFEPQPDGELDLSVTHDDSLEVVDLPINIVDTTVPPDTTIPRPQQAQRQTLLLGATTPAPTKTRSPKRCAVNLCTCTGHPLLMNKGERARYTEEELEKWWAEEDALNMV
ncbi:hypothetical protein R3P38DRAFT_3295937 [Favolaschia claudopus]|uniref:GATA-type domain-containing protein n=2 Tax=Mycenaceae TaxID=2024004 RepID=A0AAV9Z9L3_9AGAR